MNTLRIHLLFEYTDSSILRVQHIAGGSFAGVSLIISRGNPPRGGVGVGCFEGRVHLGLGPQFGIWTAWRFVFAKRAC